MLPAQVREGPKDGRRSSLPRAPLIGITCELEKHSQIEAKDKNVLNPVYSDAIIKAGGIPVMIPVARDRSGLAQLFAGLDGVMFPGSDDVSPAHFGQAPHPSLTLMPDAQFTMWGRMLDLVVEHRKPLFAICGGVQVINVWLGGSLIQDIPSLTDSQVCHHSRTHPDATHDVEVDPDSRLAGILQRTHLPINSAHHQAIDRVAERLLVTARCPQDGIVEAAEIPDHPFLVAVQWHPERYFVGDSSRRLFSAFVDACRAARETG
jgi:putative glutamine amidotransferase